MRTLPADEPEGARAAILRCIEEIPGVHLRGIERETALSLGQVLYHVDRLERMGVVVSARDAGFKRFFPARQVGRAEKPVLAALRHEAPRRILLALLEASPLSHKDLVERVGVAASTLSFHLSRLLASGIVVRERKGATNLYALAEPTLVRQELIFYRESFRDPDVDRFVRESLRALPEPDPVRVHVEDARPAQPPS